MFELIDSVTLLLFCVSLLRSLSSALFERHLGETGVPFLLGHRPSIGDFGLLAPIYAHLYRDPVPGFILRTRWVYKWVYRGCCEVLLGVVRRN